MYTTHTSQQWVSGNVERAVCLVNKHLAATGKSNYERIPHKKCVCVFVCIVHAINNEWESAIFTLAALSTRRRLYVDSVCGKAQRKWNIFESIRIQASEPNNVGLSETMHTLKLSQYNKRNHNRAHTQFATASFSNFSWKIQFGLSSIKVYNWDPYAT